MTASRDGVSSARGVSPPLVLFVSRLNTGASIMAEAILKSLAQGRVRAKSAGESTALDVVHPIALDCLRAHQIPTVGLHSKPWGEFFGLSKPPVRFLIALGDVYASKVNWSPNTLVGSWPTADPAELAGHGPDVRSAFEESFATLHARIQRFLALRWEQLKDQPLLEALAVIGEG